MVDFVIKFSFYSIFCSFEFPKQQLVESGHLFNAEEIKPKQF